MLIARRSSPTSASCFPLLRSRGSPHPKTLLKWPLNQNAPRRPPPMTSVSRPVLSVAARWRSSRRWQRRLAVVLPGSIRHEQQKRSWECDASHNASCAMRRRSLCPKVHSQSRAGPSAAPSHDFATTADTPQRYRRGSKSPLCLAATASVRRVERVSVPIDAPRGPRFSSIKVYSRSRSPAAQAVGLALATSNKPPDSRLYQEPRDGGQAAGSIATEACVLMKSHLLSQNPL